MVLSILDDPIVDGSIVVESIPQNNPGQLWIIQGVYKINKCLTIMLKKNDLFSFSWHSPMTEFVIAIFENPNFPTFSHEKQQTNLIFKHTHEDVPKCCKNCKIIKNPASGKLLTAIGLNNLIIEGRQVSLIPMIFFVLFFFSFCFFLQILYLILILKEKLHLILIVKMI